MKNCAYVFLTIFLFGCKKDITDIEILRSHQWQLIAYEQFNGTVIMAEPSYPDSIAHHMIVHFLNEDSVLGHDCVNDFWGNYGAAASNKLLVKIRSQNSAYSSVTYCREFIPTIELAESFKVVDTELFIYYDGGTKRLHFINSN